MTEKWPPIPPASNSFQCDQIASHLHCSQLLASILVHRGYNNTKRARRFVKPSLSHLQDPFLLGGMKEAVERTIVALKNKDSIVVYGDCDADGITSISIVYEVLSLWGGRVTTFIPTRTTHGRGLSVAGVKAALCDNEEAKLLISVDCGMSGAEAVTWLRDRGVDVMIIDHHQRCESLPSADILINPKCNAGAFRDPGLCAAGLSFMFASALLQKCQTLYGGEGECAKINAEQFLDLAAIGTVADNVPLVGDNRTLVKLGIKTLAKRQRSGLVAITDNVCRRRFPIDASTISHCIAPKLNAPGRIGDAGICVDLVTCLSLSRAQGYACDIEKINVARQKLEASCQPIIAEVVAEVKASHNHLAILEVEDTYEGLLGTIAFRLNVRTKVPAIVMCSTSAGIRGSIRSDRGYDLLEILESVQDLLLMWGGHAHAAGFTIAANNVEAFKQRITSLIADYSDKISKRSLPDIDAVTDIQSLLTYLHFKDGKKFAPTGKGNSPPVVAIPGCRVSYRNAKVAKHAHQYRKVSLLLHQRGKRVIVAAPAEVVPVSLEGLFDVLVVLECTRSKGRSAPSLRLIAIKPS